MLVLVIISHPYAQFGRTALYWAAREGDRKTCQCLIKKHGVSVDAQDKVRDNTWKENALSPL